MSSALGRPRVSSRDTLAEAACELFLEQGFAATSITDIASRAGVSRSSFFNYFSSKTEVLWVALDERIAALERSVAPEATERVALSGELLRLGHDLEPDALALAIANATQMEITEELERDAALRGARIARAVSQRLRSEGVDAMRADIAGAAHGGAVMAAVWAWAHAGAGASSLADTYRAALEAAASTLPPSPGSRQANATGPRTDP